MVSSSGRCVGITVLWSSSIRGGELSACQGRGAFDPSPTTRPRSGCHSRATTDLRRERLDALPTGPCLLCHPPHLTELGASSRPGTVHPVRVEGGQVRDGDIRHQVASDSTGTITSWPSRMVTFTSAPSWRGAPSASALGIRTPRLLPYSRILVRMLFSECVCT